jgi:hypothetical protein
MTGQPAGHTPGSESGVMERIEIGHTSGKLSSLIEPFCHIGSKAGLLSSEQVSPIYSWQGITNIIIADYQH